MPLSCHCRCWCCCSCRCRCCCYCFLASLFLALCARCCSRRIVSRLTCTCPCYINECCCCHCCCYRFLGSLGQTPLDAKGLGKCGSGVSNRASSGAERTVGPARSLVCAVQVLCGFNALVSGACRWGLCKTEYSLAAHDFHFDFYYILSLKRFPTCLRSGGT